MNHQVSKKKIRNQFYAGMIHLLTRQSAGFYIFHSLTRRTVIIKLKTNWKLKSVDLVDHYVYASVVS